MKYVIIELLIGNRVVGEVEADSEDAAVELGYKLFPPDREYTNPITGVERTDLMAETVRK